MFSLVVYEWTSAQSLTFRFCEVPLLCHILAFYYCNGVSVVKTSLREKVDLAPTFRSSWALALNSYSFGEKLVNGNSGNQISEFQS